MILYHYTCDHGAEGIRRDGLIRVNRMLPTDRSVVWMTDLDAPNRKGLGLTSTILTCDRLAHRFVIPEPRIAIHWNEAKRHFTRGIIDALESAPGALPMHWWVSGLPQVPDLGGDA